MALAAGAECWFLRPKYLSLDKASKLDAIRHAVSKAESKFNISYDFVYEPAMLSPRTLNKTIKKGIINKFKDQPYFERLVKYVQNDGEDLTVKFHEQITTLDKIRNENFDEVFPEWAEIVMYD